MATAEERQSVLDAFEEVENTLVAASTKLAQMQMDSMDDPAVVDPATAAVNDLSPIIENIQSAAESYQIETNRMSNEGELDG